MTLESDVRAAAKAFLETSIEALRDAGRVPDFPDDSAWIPWLTGQGLAAGHGSRLVDALRAANHTKFEAAPRVINLAERAAAGLLRAVIFTSAIRRQAPSHDDAIAERAIEELITLARRPRWAWRAVTIVTEVNADAVDGSSIYGVRIAAMADPLDALGKLIPESIQELNRLDIGGKVATAGLVVDSERDRPEARFDDPAFARISAVVAALRLATGATIEVPATIEGEPTLVHGLPPWARHGSWDPISWEKRPTTLTPDMIAGLARLAELCHTPGSSAIVVALSRYARSHRQAVWEDAIVDLATAMEATLVGDRKDEVTHALTTRASHLLATDGDPAEAIYDDVSDLYSLRSNVVHGGTDTDRLWRRLADRHRGTGGPRVAPLDRFRDLTRRAILARSLLRTDTLGDPIWPDRGIKVDRVLVDDQEKRRWRDELTGRCQALGLPRALAKAEPLTDLLAAEPESAATDGAVVRPPHAAADEHGAANAGRDPAPD